MEDDNVSTCDYDSDTPIYVGHGPLRAQQDDKDNDDDDRLSCKAIDDPVPVRDSDGLLQAESNLEQDEKQGTLPLATCLVSGEKKLGDSLSAVVEHGMESCETPKNVSLEMPETSKSHADDDDSLDWTRDSGCNWVDEYSDNDDNDDEICFGHEGKSSESLTKNEVVNSNGYCEISSFGTLSKKDCSSAGIAKNKNLDYVCSSSPLNVPQSEHLPRYKTSTGSDLDRTCEENVNKYCELEDLSCENENTESPDEQKYQKLSESELQRSSSVSKDKTVECQNTLEHSPVGKSYSLRTNRKRNCFLEGFVTSKPTCRSPAKKSTSVGGRDPKTICKEQKEEEGLNSSVIRRISPRKRDRNDQLEDHSQKKSTSQHVGDRDPKITCKEQKEEEGLNSSITRRISPRKRDRNDQPEDHSQSTIVSLVCDKNLNSKDIMMVGDQDHDSIQGKDRKSTATAKRRIENTDILDPSSDLDADVDDHEPVSSQIFTGAPMFSRSTKTKKQSCIGEGSVCLTLDDISAAGEGTHVDAIEQVVSVVPEPELEVDQSITCKGRKKCVGARSPCHDVLRTSGRQRRRKRPCQEQSERTVTGKERVNAETGKEDGIVTKTRRTNKKCETSKEEKCLKNMDNVTDDQVMPPTSASVESPLQTAHLVLNGASTEENDKESLDNLEKCDGPTPPEVKRPMYRARRCRSKGRKSANDLINILNAASASALKRVSESSTPSSKENQESIQTDQKMVSKKRRSSSRKARVAKPRQSRKRKHPSCSPEEDDLQTSDRVKGGGNKMNSSCQKADKPSNLTTSIDPSLEQHAAMLRHDSVSHDDDSGDDDDELMNPVLTPDSKTRDLPPAFSVNEVVWAQDPGDKSRWPAVVIEVAGENVSRRVYNVFKTHQTKEHYFQVKCSRYLKPYNCREKETYLEKGKGLTEFNEAVERANDFIMKIGLGKVNSYEDFFKPNDAYLDSPPPSPDYSSVPSPPLIVGHSSPEYPPHTPKINQGEVVDVDDDEEEDEEEEEGDLNNSLNSVKNNCNGASKEITRLKRKWQRKEKRLLEHMRSVQTKKYLVDIQHGKVASDRHQWFVSSNPSDKGRLLRGSFGALINEKKRFETVNYLRNLLTSEKSLLSSPRYMMEVALPEALNFAYQKTCRIGKADAEQLIHRDGQQVIRDLDIG